MKRKKFFLFRWHDDGKHPPHYDLFIEGKTGVFAWFLYFPLPETGKQRAARQKPSHTLHNVSKGGDNEKMTTLIRGECKIIASEKDKMIFALKGNDTAGKDVAGVYGLFRTRGSKWILIKIGDKKNEDNKGNVGKVEISKPGTACRG